MAKKEVQRRESAWPTPWTFRPTTYGVKCCDGAGRYARRDGRRIMVYGRGAIECWLAERVEKNPPVVPLADNDWLIDDVSLLLMAEGLPRGPTGDNER